jgi:tetratricopeptide (TPR) repeat protein
MNTIELHNKAIEIADSAFIKMYQKDFDTSKEMFKEAFKYEKEAAFSAEKENVGEPSISILFKSAISFAINAGLLNEAKLLVKQIEKKENYEEIIHELNSMLKDLQNKEEKKTVMKWVILHSHNNSKIINSFSIGYNKIFMKRQKLNMGRMRHDNSTPSVRHLENIPYNIAANLLIKKKPKDTNKSRTAISR